MSGLGGTALWDQLTEETNIYFAKDTYQEINSKEADKVVSLAQQIRADPSTYVTIIGHASGEGTIEHNQRLSENRALKVKTLLLANGVDGQHIVGARGAGSSEKAAAEFGSNQGTVEGQRSRNRRVHVIFHNDSNQPIMLVKPGAKWEAITKLPIPGWRPRPDAEPAIKNWDKLPFHQKMDWYKKLKDDIEEACKKAGIDPKPSLDMLKETLSPGPENEGPFDGDFHRTPDKDDDDWRLRKVPEPKPKR